MMKTTTPTPFQRFPVFSCGIRWPESSTWEWKTEINQISNQITLCQIANRDFAEVIDEKRACESVLQYYLDEKSKQIETIFIFL